MTYLNISYFWRGINLSQVPGASHSYAAAHLSENEPIFRTLKIMFVLKTNNFQKTKIHRGKCKNLSHYFPL
jgi:hypothetical protein